MLTPFLLGAALSALCFYITGTVSPNSSYARRTIRRIVKTSDILAVLQPGKSVVGLPGMKENTSVFVRERDGELLLDVRIQEPLENNGMRDIKAKSARVFQNTNGTVRLEMDDVTISPLRDDRPGTGQAEHVVYTIGDEIVDKDQLPPRRIKDLVSTDLEASIEKGRQTIQKTRLGILESEIRIQRIEGVLADAKAELAATQALLAVSAPLSPENHLNPENPQKHLNPENPITTEFPTNIVTSETSEYQIMA